MLWPRNGLGLPMISPVIERDVRRRFSPSTVAEPGVPGLEFGVFEFVWDLGFRIWSESTPRWETEVREIVGPVWWLWILLD
jgi:hypothetical protein